MKKLTKLEAGVWKLYRQRYTLDSIATQLNRSLPTIERAFSRAVTKAPLGEVLNHFLPL